LNDRCASQDQHIKFPSFIFQAGEVATLDAFAYTNCWLRQIFERNLTQYYAIELVSLEDHFFLGNPALEHDLPWHDTSRVGCCSGAARPACIDWWVGQQALVAAMGGED
jgi:hypothetical protein